MILDFEKYACREFGEMDLFRIFDNKHYPFWYAKTNRGQLTNFYFSSSLVCMVLLLKLITTLCQRQFPI